LLAGFVDDQAAALKRETVERADGSLRSLAVAHRYETESAGATGFPVSHDFRVGHIAMLTEQLGELRIGCTPGQIAHIDLGAHPGKVLETR
jgi:hypothetical protein